MLQHGRLAATLRPSFPRRYLNGPARTFAAKKSAPTTTTHTTTNDDDAQIAAARKWLANLDADTVRTQAPHELSYSRSSGPGGQNVNKVSSKATLRLPTSPLLALLPPLLHPAILSSRYHAAKSSELVIQADDSRKQNDNAAACFRKLHDLIVGAGREALPGETDARQVKRVEGLQKAEAAGRRRMKEAQSKKKAGRRSGGRGDD